MGLGRFVTSFASMHPSVVYTTAPASLLPSRRDDAVLRTVGQVGVGVLAAVAGVTAMRRSVVLDVWPRAKDVTTSRGNTLSVLSSLEADRRSRPVVVVEPGLLATIENLGWIIDGLVEAGRHDVVSYYRAGYGPSRRHSSTPYTLQESVDDLIDVIGSAVGEDREVVLIGHSLGGEICRRSAHALGGRVRAVVYLDSSHPEELIRSSVQRESAELLQANLVQMRRWLACGFGSLLATPEWVNDLPKAYRRRARSLYSDARLWDAAAREWSAVLEEFLSFSGTLPQLTTHALVVSADATVQDDPVHGDLHRELAQSHRHPMGSVVVRSLIVPDSDHGSLVTNPHHAFRTSEALLSFLDEVDLREEENASAGTSRGVTA